MCLAMIIVVCCQQLIWTIEGGQKRCLLTRGDEKKTSNKKNLKKSVMKSAVKMDVDGPLASMDVDRGPIEKCRLHFSIGRGRLQAALFITPLKEAVSQFPNVLITFFLKN